MKRKYRLWRQLTVVFLICVLPITITAMYFVGWSFDHAEMQLYHSLMAQANLIQSQIELDIESLEKQANNLAYDDELVQLASTHYVMTNYEIRTSVLRIYDTINAIKDSCEFVQEVSVAIPSLNHVYSSGSTLNSFDKQQWNNTTNALNSLPKNLYTVNNTLHILSAFPDYSKINYVIIDIELSNVKLRELLSQAFPETGYQIFLANPSINYALGYANENKDLFQADILQQCSPIQQNSFQQIIIENENYLYLLHDKTAGGFMTYIFVPLQEIQGILHFFRIILLAIASISLMIIISYILYIRRVINEPIQRLQSAFFALQQEDFSQQISTTRHNEFETIYDSFNAMSKKLQCLISTVYTQRIANDKAKLKQLHAQINPHFLYNSFYIIYNMAQMEDYIGIQEYAQAMSHYYQYISRDSGSVTTLAQEYKYALTYIQIQKTRFGRAIKQELETLPSHWEDLHVPKLMLQPLLENAYKYAFVDHSAQYLLKMSFVQEGRNILHIMIEDSGNTLTDEHLEHMEKHLTITDNEHWGSGISNVRQRLRLGYPEGYDLHLKRSSLGGLCVIIDLYRAAPSEEEPLKTTI